MQRCLIGDVRTKASARNGHLTGTARPCNGAAAVWKRVIAGDRATITCRTVTARRRKRDTRVTRRGASRASIAHLLERHPLPSGILPMQLRMIVRALALAVTLTVSSPTLLLAQSGAVLRGTVTDTAGRVIPCAVVRVSGTGLGGYGASTGHYHVPDVPAGPYVVRIAKLGYAVDSVVVDIAAGSAVTHDARLRPSAAVLGSVVVTAQRLGESQASALDRRQSAPNLVNVLAGDAIRELPNLNAAEAAGRIPGVTTERDEGEGKYVQIRGTEPRLSNVTINGAHVPGTQAGSRIPKLDDIPSDILAAIEVTKTLTAEQDADAIGGSVNLVTKTPEGAPSGYVAGQYGQMS